MLIFFTELRRGPSVLSLSLWRARLLLQSTVHNLGGHLCTLCFGCFAFVLASRLVSRGLAPPLETHLMYVSDS